MSALQAKRWFHNIPYEEHEKNLVLGKYNLSFVREIKDADPHTFFGSYSKLRAPSSRCHPAPSAIDGVATAGPAPKQSIEEPGFRYIDPDFVGHLLPFDEQPVMGSFEYFSRDFIGHDSVFTWEVQVTGHVSIPTACVVCSNRLDLIQLPAGLKMVQHGFSSTTSEISWNVPCVITWALSRSFELHIVLLSYQLISVLQGGQAAEQIGSLKCLVLGRDCNDRLVGIGQGLIVIPETVKLHLPESRKVNWLVA
jgi:hypothetical protein